MFWDVVYILLPLALIVVPIGALLVLRAVIAIKEKQEKSADLQNQSPSHNTKDNA